MTLVLSLFPGIGLLDMAFEAEGFCVVRGPDVLWGGDIRNFHPPAGKFDGVIGGPPCQAFSSLSNLVRANGNEPRFGNLIPEFERCVAEVCPKWFVMEEVRAAPVPQVAGFAVSSFLWNNSWVPSEDGLGQEQERLRRFSFGVQADKPINLRKWLRPATFLLPEAASTVTQWTPDNSAQAKCRSNAVTKSGPGPNTRDRVRQRTCTTLGPHHLANLSASTAKVRRQAVLGSNLAVPVKIGGSGKVKASRVPAVTGSHAGQGNGRPIARYGLADACHLQGLPRDFLGEAPFTAREKLRLVANGVPLPLGRAIAKAVKEALA